MQFDELWHYAAEQQQAPSSFGHWDAPCGNACHGGLLSWMGTPPTASAGAAHGHGLSHRRAF